jgi:hypothetical protein
MAQVELQAKTVRRVKMARVVPRAKVVQVAKVVRRVQVEPMELLVEAIPLQNFQLF